jgi:hypothetical protein
MKVGDKQKYIKRSTSRGVQLLSGKYKSPIWSTSEAWGSTDVQLYSGTESTGNVAIEDGGSWDSVKRDPDMYN